MCTFENLEEIRKPEKKIGNFELYIGYFFENNSEK